MDNFQTSVDLFQKGRFEEALISLSKRKSLHLKEKHLKALCYYNLYETDHALRLFLELDAASFSIKKEIALCWIRKGKFREAATVLENALLKDPHNIVLLKTLGLSYSFQGLTEKSYQIYKLITSLNPSCLSAYHSQLILSHYFSKITPQEHYEQHKIFGSFLEGSITPYSHLEKRHHKKIKVGYVSPDFRDHSVAFFIYPLLLHHNSQMFDVTLYHNHSVEDERTHDLKSHVTTFKNVHRLSDQDLADMIYQDEIDILVDLAGHTGKNRLTTFAYQPAPIQWTYLGYPNTTGLSRIHYRFTDLQTDPLGNDVFYTEKLIRLPCFLSYHPFFDNALCKTPPCAQKGYISFGCFNDRKKITPEIIRLWSCILEKVPHSKLLLKNIASADSDYDAQKDRFDFFIKNGINREKLIEIPFAKTRDNHLASYGDLDISLDPFPYNGTTSTCESLWMGVPVVTLSGTTHVSRVSGSILSQIQLDDCIAYDNDDYIKKAVALAQNIPRLQELRQDLRFRMQNSLLMNGKELTHHIEKAYIEAYDHNFS